MIALAYENNETGATQALSDATTAYDGTETAKSMGTWMWDDLHSRHWDFIFNDPFVPQQARSNYLALLDLGSGWMIEGNAEQDEGEADLSDADILHSGNLWAQSIAKSEEAMNNDGFGGASTSYGSAATAFASADLILQEYGY